MEWTWVPAVVLAVAATIAVVAYTRGSRTEARRLHTHVELARKLREGQSDPVRVAAADEFETAVYRRLFYVSTVTPKLRSAAWALLAAAIALAVALPILAADTIDGLIRAAGYVALGGAVAFVIAAVSFGLAAVWAAAVVPRVVIDDPVDDAEPTEVAPDSEDVAASAGAPSDTDS